MLELLLLRQSNTLANMKSKNSLYRTLCESLSSENVGSDKSWNALTHRLLGEQARGVLVGADVGQPAPALQVGPHRAQTPRRLPAPLGLALL